ncbi:MAG: hypothetical protein AABY10_01125 [Nanoarchaeota archaeon]
MSKKPLIYNLHDPQYETDEIDIDTINDERYHQKKDDEVTEKESV